MRQTTFIVQVIQGGNGLKYQSHLRKLVLLVYIINYTVSIYYFIFYTLLSMNNNHKSTAPSLLMSSLIDRHCDFSLTSTNMDFPFNGSFSFFSTKFSFRRPFGLVPPGIDNVHSQAKKKLRFII